MPCELSRSAICAVELFWKSYDELSSLIEPRFLICELSELVNLKFDTYPTLTNFESIDDPSAFAARYDDSRIAKSEKYLLP